MGYGSMDWILTQALALTWTKFRVPKNVGKHLSAHDICVVEVVIYVDLQQQQQQQQQQQ
jgi:hypothetical protein